MLREPPRPALPLGVISITPDAVISIDGRQRIICFNPGAEKIFGHAQETMLGQPLDLLIPERFRKAHADHIRKFASSGETMRFMSERPEVCGMHKDGHEFPAEAAIMSCQAQGEQILTVVLRDVSERKRREEHLRLVTRELHHRVSNVLARFKALVQISRSGKASVSEYSEGLLARIHSMARAHDQLARADWRGVTLSELVADQLAPYARHDNLRIEGPEIMLPPDAAQALSMVFHELATNAVKYGSLSEGRGQVTVAWQRNHALPETLQVEWREQDGPRVRAPEREGYGSSLIRGVLNYELGGVVAFDYPSDGAICAFSLPLDRLQANLSSDTRD